MTLAFIRPKQQSNNGLIASRSGDGKWKRCTTDSHGDCVHASCKQAVPHNTGRSFIPHLAPAVHGFQSCSRKGMWSFEGYRAPETKVFLSSRCDPRPQSPLVSDLKHGLVLASGRRLDAADTRIIQACGCRLVRFYLESCFRLDRSQSSPKVSAWIHPLGGKT
jgi:hypothetical protein